MSRIDQIKALLTGEFSPTYLEVVDESHQHNVPEGAESHFKVTLVSACFDSLPLVKRHQQVYGLLAGLMGTAHRGKGGGIHALVLHTFSPQEWDKRPQVAPSPACLGGGSKQPVGI